MNYTPHPTLSQLLDLSYALAKAMDKAVNNNDIEVRVSLSETDMALAVPGLVKLATVLKTFKHIAVEVDNGSAVVLKLKNED